jgi:hypothetical protein
LILFAFASGIGHFDLRGLLPPSGSPDRGRMKRVYLGAAVMGTVLPYYYFLQFLFEHGFDVGLMLQELFQNRISAFFGMDVIVSALLLLAFILAEGERLDAGRRWACVVGTLLVGSPSGCPCSCTSGRANRNRIFPERPAATGLVQQPREPSMGSLLFDCS